MKKELVLLIRWIGIVIGLFILVLIVSDSGIFISKNEEYQESRCPVADDKFSEADLYGTWKAETPGKSDTLIIRSDGTYNQTIHIEFAEKSPIDYTSEWNSWHLEFSEQNIPYIHLSNFAFCGMNARISCMVRDGDGHDFCTDKYISMDGEGILLVLGEIGDVTNKIVRQDYLNMFYPLGDQGSWVYEFVEQ